MNAILSVQDVSELMPDVQCSLNKIEISVKEYIEKFHPRVKDYIEAGFSEEEIEEKLQTCLYFIPERQRYYVWNKSMQNKLIDSILKNYPIPDLIISDGEVRGTNDQEDGQQRCITLWKYKHNQFAYHPNNDERINIYYSRKPDNEPNSYTLDEFTAQKFQFDNYKLSIKSVNGISGYDIEALKPIIFERLNSGKTLTSADRLWNNKSYNLVKSAIDIGKNIELYPLLYKHFKINTGNIADRKNRTDLSYMVSIVLALNTPFVDPDRWGDVLTTSYGLQCEYLTIDVNYDTTINALKAILQVYENAHVGNKAYSNNTHQNNRALTRHLGLMLRDWKIRTANNSSEAIYFRFIDYWTKILNIIRETELDIEHPDHISSRIYYDGDKVGKNNQLGKWSKQRYERIIQIARDDYEIDYI